MVNIELDFFASDPTQIKTWNDIYRALDEIIEYDVSDKYVVSTEKIGGVMGRLLVYIADTFTRIGSMVARDLNVFNWTSGNSELVTYYTSHRLLVNKIEKLPMVEVGGTQVPVPTGLKTDYATVVKAVGDAVAFADMVDRSERFQKELYGIYQSIASDDFTLTSAEKKLKDHTDYVLILNKNFMKSVAKCYKFGNTPSRHTRKYSEVFKPGELKKIREEMMGHEKDIISIKKVHKQMKKTEEHTDKFIATIESEVSDVSVGTIKYLARYVKTCAETFESYGTLATELLKIDHNMTEVYRALKR